MEQWHQKLHNNTSPDDVAICEALLAYLAAGLDVSAYWDTLHVRHCLGLGFGSRLVLGLRITCGQGLGAAPCGMFPLVIRSVMQPCCASTCHPQGLGEMLASSRVSKSQHAEHSRASALEPVLLRSVAVL